jgi:uncharacterized protein
MSQTTLETRDASAGLHGSESLVVYFLLGIYLGVIFIKSEVASWFRIQEMFLFDAFHMYGVIGAAVAIAALSVFLMKRTGMRTVRGDRIEFPAGEETRPAKSHVYGGLAFGLGWGLIGACPGPMFALIGSGIPVMLVGLLAALAGAWTYGLLRPRLPH